MALYTEKEMFNISTNIKNLRRSKGETQEQFGKRFNCNKSMISRWELGKSSPKINTLFTIASLAKVSTVDFINKYV